MQRTIRARYAGALLLAAALTATGPAAAAAAPVPASAGFATINALARDQKEIDLALASAVKTIDKTTKGLNADVATLTKGLAATNAQVATLTSGLAATNAQVATNTSGLASTNSSLSSLTSAVSSGSTTITTDLTNLSNAVQNSSTGLPGLNAARPQFVFLTVASSQFSIPNGGYTPEATPTIVGQTPSPGGEVLINFGEDESTRAIEVTSTDVGTDVTGQAVDCASLPAADCAALGGTGGNGTTGNPNEVLVSTFADAVSTSTPTAAPVSVVAISG